MASEINIFYSYGFFAEPSLPFLGLWSAGEKRMLADTGYGDRVRFLGGAVDAERRRMVYLVREGQTLSVDSLGFEGAHERLGTLGFEIGSIESGGRATQFALDPRAGQWLGVVFGNEAYVVEIGENALASPRLLGQHGGGVTSSACDPLGRFFATAGENGEIRLWSVDGASPSTAMKGPLGGLLRVTDDGSLLIAYVTKDKELSAWGWSLESFPPRFLRPFEFGPQGSTGVLVWDTSGRRVASSGPDLKIRLWPLAAPADAEPLLLLRGEALVLWGMSFHPRGQWLASADKTGVALWPLTRSYPAVIRRHEQVVLDVAFDPKGRWLASASLDDTVRLWPLEGDVPLPGRTLLEAPGKHMLGLAVAQEGEKVLVGTDFSGALMLPVSGGKPLPVPNTGPGTYGVSISADGGLGAGVDTGAADTEIRVWGLDSGEALIRLRPPGKRVFQLEFTDDGHLLSSSELGLRKWDLETGDSELIYQGSVYRFAASSSGDRAVVIERLSESDPWGRAVHVDLDTSETMLLEAHGSRVSAVDFDSERATVVTGDIDGIIRVGHVTDEEPFVLLGHDQTIWSVEIDPLGRWIASGGQDTTVRLWPTPDLSKPPLHTLPREELIAKLKSLTNLRAVRDPESSTGWKIEVGPFPGWATVPEW
jgi:WD40 repeat protein